jgi:chromosome segregation ATPase
MMSYNDDVGHGRQGWNMQREVQERFERIERNLEHASERIVQITDAHVELETAQANSQKAIDRISSKVEDVTERLANLTILVDRLIERDLGRT